jgi:hypothetical protein
MIDEYKAEMNKPVKVFNPNVGRDGAYAVYKYKPSSIDLTPVPPEDLGIVLTDNDIKNLSAGIIQLNLEYKRLDKATREFPKIKKQLEDEFNRAKARELRAFPAGAIRDNAFYDNLIAELEKYDNPIKGVNRINKQKEIAAELGISANSGVISTNKAKILDEIARQRSAPPPVSKADKDFFDGIRLLEDEITATDDRQKEIKVLIDEIRNKIADNKKVIHDNNIKQAEADKLTKAKVGEALKELEILNSGKSIPTQQVGESDDDYRLRLQEIGNEVLDDDEVEREAGLLQNVKAKYNLKELLSDEGQIETIIKKLTPDELTEMNTMFTGIKKKYLETYGFNNTNMNVNKIVDFVKQTIPSINSSLSAPAKPLALAPSPSPAPEPEPVAPTTRASNTTGPYSLASFNKTQLLQLVDDHNLNRGTREQMYDQLLQAGLIPMKGSAFIPAFPEAPTIDPTLVPTTQPTFGANLQPMAEMTAKGLGVHLKKLPKVIKLGHIHINPSNLYYENILSVRNPKNKPLRAYKDEHLSEYLASLLIKLVEGGHITKHELQPLSDHEKMIYDNLIKRSKLHKMHDNSFEQTALKMKQRLEVLEGELEAGNNNPLIKSEIHGLLFKLAHAKVISQVDATKHWKSLNEIYLN